MSAATPANPMTPEPALDPLRRAGRVVMFLGTLEIVLFGLVTFAVTRASRMSVAELREKITGASVTLEQLEAVHPQLKMFAISLALFGVVPGAIFLICSVSLRRWTGPASITALLLAATQLFVLGAVLLRQILQGLANGDPPAITYSVLGLGTPMAFLVFVIRCLFAARKAGARFCTHATLAPLSASDL